MYNFGLRIIMKYKIKFFVWIIRIKVLALALLNLYCLTWQPFSYLFRSSSGLLLLSSRLIVAVLFVSACYFIFMSFTKNALANSLKGLGSILIISFMILITLIYPI